MTALRPLLARCSLACLLLTLNGTPALSQQIDADVQYILDRYIEAMGGRASLERIKSVRLSGTVLYPNGSKNAITVIKKKPDLVRVILDTGTLRFIQAYDGKTAWFSRESGRNSFHDRMRGELRDSFIREAPLENVLINPQSGDLVVERGEDVTISQTECFQIIARFPNGSKVTHYIEKETFLERRILEYDVEGNLLAELIPGKFEIIDGVYFATQIVRRKDGKTISTLVLDDISTNIGILDSAFTSPVELPAQ